MERPAVGVTLHEEDALVTQLELVVRVAILVLGETGSLYQTVPLWNLRRLCTDQSVY